MRRNYFVKLLKYMKNVYHIDHGLSRLTDRRVSPKYKTPQVILITLLAFQLRIKSMNELKYLLKENEFRSLFSSGTQLPQIDTIIDTLKSVDTIGLKSILKYTVRKAQKNKVFQNGTIGGLTVAAIDGTKFFGSNIKCCSECMKRNGHNFHSGAVMSTIGDTPTMVLGFDQQRSWEENLSKEEGELNVAKRLIASIKENYGTLVDVVVYDALACNSVWINHCVNLGIDVVVRAKENNIKSLRKIKKETNKKDPKVIWYDKDGYERVEVYESEYEMEHVDQALKFVKFTMKRSNDRYSQIMIVTTLMETGLHTLFKMIRGRWDIENSIFNNLKTECGLEHCYIHNGNAIEAILCLIFIASNIMQLFLTKRLRNQYGTQKEIVRLLFKGLYFLKYQKEYSFSTA